MSAKYLPLRDGETTEQFEIMQAGKPYLAVDPYLNRVRNDAAEKLASLNKIGDTEKRMKVMRDIIDMRSTKPDPRVYIMNPFTFEYGFNISVGEQVYVGPNCQFIDVNAIHIGDRTMIGTNCQFYTPSHPIVPELRNGLDGPEWAKPITIGKDCWLGGGVVVLPGVTIGDGVTIGAASVVTKDIPSRTVAVGNPARVIKKIEEDGTVVAVPC